MYVKKNKCHKSVPIQLHVYRYARQEAVFLFLAACLRSERRGSTLASKGPPKAGGCPRGTRWLPQELALSAPPIGSNFALNSARCSRTYTCRDRFS